MIFWDKYGEKRRNSGIETEHSEVQGSGRVGHHCGG
jgi:hypothetical protein